MKSLFKLTSDVVSWFAGLFGFGHRDDEEVKGEVEKIIAQVDPHVQKLFKKYPPKEFISYVEGFAGIGVEMVHILSILIREAEELEGKKGAEKKEIVIDIFLYYYRQANAKFDIKFPGVPDAFEEPLLRLVLSIAIDYIVSLFDLNFGDRWVKSQLDKQAIMGKVGLH